MKKIGLLSDTHGYLDPMIFEYFAACDEVWHAGDFGTTEVSDQLQAFKPLKGVYGNIDGKVIRAIHPLDQRFSCEQVEIWMTHIGGYPGRYEPRVREQLRQKPPPKLFICGHSHILKVMLDDKLNDMLCMNPGAVGRQGLHKIRTALRFAIDGSDIKDLEVIELGKRG